jgi:hypothetical protein
MDETVSHLIFISGFAACERFGLDANIFFFLLSSYFTDDDLTSPAFSRNKK